MNNSNYHFAGWSDLICSLSTKGHSVALGLFSTDGKLLLANAAMCYYLNTNETELQPQNFFVNPQFESFTTGEGLVFEGYTTIGNYADSSFVLLAKVYKQADQVFVFAEPNVPELFENNLKLSELNQQVNNLQRQLIKEKKSLELVNSQLKTKTRELEIANQKLQELNLEKNRYIGMVAHDLRNPIGVAESFSALIIEDLNIIDKETELEYLWHINKSCNFSLDLIHNFLNVSKIEASVFELKLKTVNYVSFVKEAIKQEQIFACNKEQQIVFKPKIKRLSVKIDQNKMQQVFNNLLSNAVKYSMPGTTITVNIELSNNEVLTSIADHGQGIPANEIAELFTPFHTTSVKPTGKEKSTGLGLSIVKKIIEAHGGKIWAQSEVGVGSTFYFTINIG